jgi:flagella basal body P-ring formation protein FlgA
MINYLIIFLLLFSLNAGASNDKIIEASKKLLYDNNAFIYGPNDEDIELSLNIGTKSSIDKADFIDIKLLNLDKKNRFFSASISLKDQKDKIFQHNISGHYEEFIMLPVVKTAFKKGEIIQDNDLDRIRISVSKIRKSVIKDESEIIGKTPKYYIQAHSFINPEELTMPKIIAKGDMVNVIYNNNSINIKMTAQALDAGAKGDVIRVKNTRSNVTLQAIVESSDTAMIPSPN